MVLPADLESLKVERWGSNEGPEESYFQQVHEPSKNVSNGVKATL